MTHLSLFRTRFRLAYLSLAVKPVICTAFVDIWALATSSDNLQIDIFATQHRTYVIGKDFGNRLWRHLNVLCPILCTCSNLSIDGAPSHSLFQIKCLSHQHQMNFFVYVISRFLVKIKTSLKEYTVSRYMISKSFTNRLLSSKISLRSLPSFTF